MAPRTQEVKDKIRKALLGRHLTEETREKMRGPRGPNGSHAGKGIPLSPEHRANIGRANKGKVISEDQRLKLRAANKGKHPTEETRAKMAASQKGRHHSKETRAKMSAANLGHSTSEETRAKIGSKSVGRYCSPGSRLKISAATVKRLSMGTLGWVNGFRHPSEAIVASWMTSQDWDWRYEEKPYLIENASAYWPDFHVYQNEKLWKIVEVKSYPYSRLKGKVRSFWEQYSLLPFEVWDGPKLQQLGIL